MVTQTVMNEEGLCSPCRLCGGRQWTFVRKGRDLYQSNDEAAFSLEQCLTCGQIMQNPPPTDAQLGKAYAAEYAPYRAAWKERGWHVWKMLRDWTTWRRMQRLRRYAQGTRLLEVGCGAGDFLYATYRAGWDVRAVEYSAPLAETLRTELGLDVRTGDLSPGLWESNSFDAVILWSVLEHVRNPFDTLSTVCSYLRPGGAALLQIPTLYGVEQGQNFGEYWALLDLPRHLTFFGRECLANLCDQAGMDLVVFKTPLLETAWCHFASVCSYAGNSQKTGGRVMQILSRAFRSLLSFPAIAVRAWRGQGTEAFAVAVKR